MYGYVAIVFVLEVSMLQNTTSCDRVETIQKGDRRGDVSATAHERAAPRSIQMRFDPLSNWTLGEYRRVCAGLMNEKHFDAMAVKGKNLVIHNRNGFKRDTALSACE